MNTKIATEKENTNKTWKFPPTDLLSEPPVRETDTSNLDKKVKIIEDTLKSFGVIVDVVSVKTGASVTQYVLNPIKVTKNNISTLQGNLAMNLESPTGSIRVEAPIPETSLIGIEVPNNKREIVYFKSIIESPSIRNLESKLSVALGEDLAGKVITYDIDKMPHLLMNGTTGSGKSMFIHNMLFSLFYRATPYEVKLILIDPKRVEFMHYRDIPYLLRPIITDPDEGLSVFSWAVEEMDRRIATIKESGAKDIKEYHNKVGNNKLPYIVIVVDEFGDLIIRDQKEFEKSIVKLSQLTELHGIHIVLASSRASTESYTGIIKGNIPCRAVFQTLNQIDSRVIIDQPGAEKLMGKGDMLFVYPETTTPIRLQVPYISDKEIELIAEFIKEQATPEYDKSLMDLTSYQKKS